MCPSVLVFSCAAMDEEASNSQRRMSTRTRKVAPRMAAALASSDNRTQVCLCMLVLFLCLTLYLYIPFGVSPCLSITHPKDYWQAMLARIEALENDNAGLETIQVDDEDDEVSLDDDDQGQSLFSYFISD